MKYILELLFSNKPSVFVLASQWSGPGSLISISIVLSKKCYAFTKIVDLKDSSSGIAEYSIRRRSA